MRRGATAALLGGNGAGKTTTLSMLLGLLLPTAGSIAIFGEDMMRHRYRVLPRMNFSSPYVDLPHRLTVRQNLVVYGRLYGIPDRGDRIAALAADLQIEDFLDRPTGKLQPGQKTRVALAKALLNEPELLLLDEPTASLDPDTGDWVRSYLETYRARTGATILLASHNMAEVERLCSRRHDDAPRPHRRSRRAGRRSSRAMAAPRWSRSSSTSRAAPARCREARDGGGAAARIDAGDGFSPARVCAMMLRYLYLLRSSWPRALELIYWPTIQMILWGLHEPVPHDQQLVGRERRAACCSPRCCCGT